MPVILKVGYDYYLCESEAAGIAALKALGKAVVMEQGYERGAGYVYFPRERDRRSHEGIELKIVENRQLRKSKPREEDEEVREVKLLDFNGKVNYQGGGES